MGPGQRAAAALMAMGLALGAGPVGAAALRLTAPRAAPGPEESSRPSDFAALGDRVFFSARTEALGEELWVTLGTEGATAPVLDLRPGPSGARPRHLTALGGRLYFAADDGGGEALWASDGTAEGTERVALPVSGAGVSFEHLEDAEGVLLITEQQGADLRLWTSDGSGDGTRLVWSRGGEAGWSLRGKAVALNGALYFSAGEDCRGCGAPELWSARRGEAPTLLFRGPALNLTPLGGLVYFAGAQDWSAEGRSRFDLWRTDGTAAGTERVKDFAPGSLDVSEPFAAMGTALFFRAAGSSGTDQVWRSDGTAAGTRPLVPGAPGSTPGQLTAAGGALYYTASSAPGGGRALWRSDGTGPATAPVAEGIGEAPLERVAHGDSLLYATVDAIQVSLFAVEASGAPRLLKTFVAPDDGSSLGLTSTPLGVLFAADGGAGLELWRSDGSPGGTVQIEDLWPAGRGVSPRELTGLGGALLFGADDGAQGGELWRSDGTPEGTGLLRELEPGAAGAEPKNLTRAGGQVFFTARGAGGQGVLLWRTDGSAAGTTLLRSGLADDSDCQGVDLSSCSGSLTAAGGALFFTDWGSGGFQLWRSDGTPEGTSLVRGGFRQPLIDLTAVGGELYFGGDWSPAGTSLGYSDGTPDGTAMVANLALPTGSAFPEQITEVDSLLFFTAYAPGSLHPVLWRSDRTAGGTRPLLDPLPWAGGPVIRGLTRIGHQLFFTADDGVHGWELWVSDGTEAGTRMIADLAPGAAGAQPTAPAELNGGAVFWAHDGAHGWELWRSDGTEAGTQLVRDIGPGPAGAVGDPGPIYALGPQGPLVTAASDGATGLELWRTDGTAEGTYRVEDLAPGPAPSNPSDFASAGASLYFAADDGQSGRALWSVPLASLGAPPSENGADSAAGSSPVEAGGAATAGGCQSAPGQGPMALLACAALGWTARRRKALRARRESNTEPSDSKSDALSN